MTLTPVDADLDDPIAWGRQLIRSRDIDPIYDMLVDADLTQGTLARWLLSYWLFYHAGFASYAAEQSTEQFWDTLATAAKNTEPSPLGGRWPRSPERRHFRGEKCVQAVAWFRNAKPDPEPFLTALFAPASGSSYLSFQAGLKRVLGLPQFGPWIGFKVLDMGERVWGAEIHFPDDVAFFDSPSEGMKAASVHLGTDLPGTLTRLVDGFIRLNPPGLRTRGCGVQEVETVMCKWKSARGGHYHIGKDLSEIRHGMKGWGALADRLLTHLPPPIC